MYGDSPEIAVRARRRSDMSGLGGGRRSSSKEKVLVATFFLLKYVGYGWHKSVSFVSTVWRVGKCGVDG